VVSTGKRSLLMERRARQLRRGGFATTRPSQAIQVWSSDDGVKPMCRKLTAARAASKRDEGGKAELWSLDGLFAQVPDLASCAAFVSKRRTSADSTSRGPSNRTRSKGASDINGIPVWDFSGRSRVETMRAIQREVLRGCDESAPRPGATLVKVGAQRYQLLMMWPSENGLESRVGTRQRTAVRSRQSHDIRKVRPLQTTPVSGSTVRQRACDVECFAVPDPVSRNRRCSSTVQRGGAPVALVTTLVTLLQQELRGNCWHLDVSCDSALRTHFANERGSLAKACGRPTEGENNAGLDARALRGGDANVCVIQGSTNRHSDCRAAPPRIRVGVSVRRRVPSVRMTGVTWHCEPVDLTPSSHELKWTFWLDSGGCRGCLRFDGQLFERDVVLSLIARYCELIGCDSRGGMSALSSASLGRI